MKHNRFLNIYVTANSGWFDFAFTVPITNDKDEAKLNKLGAAFQSVDLGIPAYPTERCWYQCRSDEEPWTIKFPDIGTVHLPVTCEDVRKIARDKNADCDANRLGSLAVQWASAPDYRGKIRVMSHGDGYYLRMRNAAGSEDWDKVSGKQFARYLVNCGIRHRKEDVALAKPPQGWGARKPKLHGALQGGSGVCTIVLILCRGGALPLVQDPNSGVIVAQLISTQKQVAEELSDHKINGVVVTASEHCLSMMMQEDIDEQVQLNRIIGGSAKAGDIGVWVRKGDSFEWFKFSGIHDTKLTVTS